MRLTAVILRGLAFKVQNSKNIRDGRQWFYDPIDTIAKERWPFIPPVTLHDTMDYLAEKNLIIRDRKNKKRYDRTTWYSMDQAVINAAAEDRRSNTFILQRRLHFSPCSTVFAE